MITIQIKVFNEVSQDKCKVADKFFELPINYTVPSAVIHDMVNLVVDDLMRRVVSEPVEA